MSSPTGPQEQALTQASLGASWNRRGLNLLSGNLLRQELTLCGSEVCLTFQNLGNVERDTFGNWGGNYSYRQETKANGPFDLQLHFTGQHLWGFQRLPLYISIYFPEAWALSVHMDFWKSLWKHNWT